MSNSRSQNSPGTIIVAFAWKMLSKIKSHVALSPYWRECMHESEMFTSHFLEVQVKSQVLNYQALSN